MYWIADSNSSDYGDGVNAGYGTGDGSGSSSIGMIRGGGWGNGNTGYTDGDGTGGVRGYDAFQYKVSAQIRMASLCGLDLEALAYYYAVGESCMP